MGAARSPTYVSGQSATCATMPDDVGVNRQLNRQQNGLEGASSLPRLGPQLLKPVFNHDQSIGTRTSDGTEHQEPLIVCRHVVL
jgi:hypothetical protein